MNAADKLLEYWRNYDVVERGLHSGDGILDDPQNLKLRGLRDNCQSTAYFNEKTELHLGLRPKPYGGNIRKAVVYFLLLNPANPWLSSTSVLSFVISPCQIARQRREFVWGLS